MTKFLAIVDPWDKPKPYDSEEFPFLASDIDAQCKLIYNQLSRLKPLFDDIIVVSGERKPHPIFDELPNYFGIENNYIPLNRKDEFWNVWLCGFHYGRCIHSKIDSVKNEFNWSLDRFHIIKNLSFTFPGDNLQSRANSPTALNTREYYWDYNKNLYENIKNN